MYMRINGKYKPYVHISKCFNFVLYVPKYSKHMFLLLTYVVNEELVQYFYTPSFY